MNSSSHPEQASNLAKIFCERAARYGNRDALLYKVQNTFRPITWSEWSDRVKKTALALYSLGVRKGDRVGILSENRPEWTFADFGVLSLAAADVPIYPTLTASEILYILKNAGVEVLFVSTPMQYEKIKNLLSQLPILRKIILFDGDFSTREKVISFPAFLEKGRREILNNPDLYHQLVDSVIPSDLATIIYTSGTTGPPKGVMLTHQNFIANYLGSSERIPISDEDRALSFLPLSHIFERLAGYYFMAFHGAPIAYAENMQTVPEDILTVRPTVAAAVPRFYEKMYARILERIENGPSVMRRLFTWAVSVGREYGNLRRTRKRIPFSLRSAYFFANRLVLRKLKARLGGRIRFFISGGAPLSKELAEFFYAAGVLILEGYGLTETSPVITVNSPEQFSFGTVGHALSNVEVRIDDDGEILTRGPCVMKGYYQNEAATNEAVQDGWFRTGDIGVLDDAGFLKITDRKKDIIVTSGGKNVSPQNIENLLLGDKLFSQVVVLGDKRNYLVALIVPSRHEVHHFAKEQGLNHLSFAELLRHPLLLQWIEGRLHERTKDLATYEQIKYFALLDHELSQESGDLTPTLKVRRKIVMEKYKNIIDGLYDKGAQHARR